MITEIKFGRRRRTNGNIRVVRPEAGTTLDTGIGGYRVSITAVLRWNNLERGTGVPPLIELNQQPR